MSFYFITIATDFPLFSYTSLPLYWFLPASCTIFPLFLSYILPIHFHYTIFRYNRSRRFRSRRFHSVLLTKIRCLCICWKAQDIVFAFSSYLTREEKHCKSLQPLLLLHHHHYSIILMTNDNGVEKSFEKTLEKHYI